MYVRISSAGDFIQTCAGIPLEPDEYLLILLAKDSAPHLDAIIAGLSGSGIPFFGAIFPALIEGTEVHEQGAVIKTCSLLAPPAIALMEGGAVDWIAPLPEATGIAPRSTCMILTDFACLEIDIVLDQLFNRHGDQVGYFGAGVGLAVREPNPVIFSPDGRFTGAVIVAYLRAEADIDLRHGWSRVSDPIVATLTDGNILKELNWEPAMDVYRTVVGDEIADALRSQKDIPKAKRYPFGIAREGLEDVVRDPLVSTSEHDLVVLSNVPPNAVLHVLEGNTDRLIAAAGELGQAFPETHRQTRCLLFDCFSRAKLMGDSFGRELDTFRDALRKRAPSSLIEGALALGEIASDGQRLPDMHNKTMAAALFHES